MSSKHIKTGSEVVNDFVASLSQESKVDKDVLEAIQVLLQDDQYTTTRLPQKLAELRECSIEKQSKDG